MYLPGLEILVSLGTGTLVACRPGGSSCRRNEMLLPGIVKEEDYGCLFYANRLDTLRVGCSVHGCDHGAMDFLA